MKILVNSSISKVDGMDMRVSRQCCAGSPLEVGVHAVSEFIRAITIKTRVEDY